ncbi:MULTISPECIES: hypothetical protein [Erysipelotrichaceae]|jgi:hypothetical protein|uniref:hypothetical protein n=1 Tax=Erysipelotrichaceae TaxID=128827 RepID=UPI000E3F27C8|nr:MULTISPECIES: hypothetical protein [unclassified Absiella]RGB66909.1 hypothetical protein DW113_08130 [Absiella sp. AM09-45]RGB76243.1 hypothetical protein DW114_09165 [Absiella sp. AM09-50]RGC24454.1 hypothetical protein DXA09_05105 [Absiella sp. AM54-8XD]RHU04579.1 hypothetical protein DW716_14250 [Absiella sp. AM27-20]
MLKTEFGIVEYFDNGEYVIDESIGVIYIDEDKYINDWWNKLLTIKTYFHNLDRPAQALARWGITLIPPESLPAFQDIILSDKRINEDTHLVELANLISMAINNNKFIIHFGV